MSVAADGDFNVIPLAKRPNLTRKTASFVSVAALLLVAGTTTTMAQTAEETGSCNVAVNSALVDQSDLQSCNSAGWGSASYTTRFSHRALLPKIDAVFGIDSNDRGSGCWVSLEARGHKRKNEKAKTARHRNEIR